MPIKDNLNTIATKIDKAAASVLSPKAKDCQRQLDAAPTVWAIDGKWFLFIFSEETNEEGKQKVSVWGLKRPGDYQRIKTVWISRHDNLYEAVEKFLCIYFELFILTATYSSDIPMLQDIEMRMKEVQRYTPANLKQKLKLLRVWSDIMPRFNAMVAEQAKGDEKKALNEKKGNSKNIFDYSQILELRSFDEPFKLDPVAESIVNSLDFNAGVETSLIMAVLAYDYAAMLHEIRTKTAKEREARENRMLLCTSALMHLYDELDFKDPVNLRYANAIAYMGLYAAKIKFEKMEKAIAGCFKAYTQIAIRENLPPTADSLELFVNTRRLNKRLPLEISAYIKTDLDHHVHTDDGFRILLPESSSITDRMRILWLRSMALKLYGYDPNKSYTRDELRNLMPELLQTKDPEALLLYTRILHEAGLDTIMIHDFDTLLITEAASFSPSLSESRSSIQNSKSNIQNYLTLHTAFLLYQASAQQLVPLQS